MENDLRTLRDRTNSAWAALDSAEGAEGDGCSAAILAQTTTVTTYPTTPSAFYAIILMEIDGEEQEGSTASYVTVTGAPTLYALNLGSQVPPPVTMVICHLVGGRYCFRFDG